MDNSAFTETQTTQTMKTHQMAQLKLWIQPFPNPVSQMYYFQIQPIKCPVQNNEISTCLL